MEVKNLETYEQLQMEAVIRSMTILEFAKKYKSYEVDNKYFIYGKRIFAFDSNGKFLDGDYKVNDSFSCSYYGNNLTSLVGAPKVVNGSFYCGECDKLTSLEGAPKVVKGDFNCSGCMNLTSLKGAPKVVKGCFYCGFCEHLTSLEDASKVVEGDFNCYGCWNLPRNIKKLEGVKGDFNK